MITDQKYLDWQKKLAENKLFRWFWKFWAFYGVVFAMLFIPYYFTFKQGWKIPVLALISGLVAHYIVCKLIHLIYPKAHPYQRLNFKVLTSRIFSHSDEVRDAFPSEHVTSMAAIVAIFYLFFPPLGYLGFGILILVAYGRIILGYHDLNDVFFGAIIGVISGLGLAQLLIPILFK